MCYTTFVPATIPPEAIPPVYIFEGENHLAPRFAQYLIANGTIRPADGAALGFYDPWAEYKRLGRARLAKPPYVPFLNMARRVSFRPKSNGGFGPTEETTAAVLEWCNEYGLLGVLPGTFQKIRYPSRILGTAKNGDQLRVAFKTIEHRRQSGFWQSLPVESHIDIQAQGQENDLDITGIVKDRFRDFYPEGLATVWHWETCRWTDQPLGANFHRFFPTVSPNEPFEHPMPTADLFWKLYGEPMDVFGRIAIRFLEAAEALAEAKFEQYHLQTPASVVMALTSLSSLADAIGFKPMIDPETNLFRRVRHSPAIVCSFADMFLKDLEAGLLLKKCESCLDFFVAREKQVLYCSERCRNRVQRRRTRIRAKDGKIGAGLD